MRKVIEFDEEVLKRYAELEESSKGYLKTMHERMPLYKGDVKKFEKDLIYKEASYNFTINSIEMKDIRDKLFEQVYSKWKNKK